MSTSGTRRKAAEVDDADVGRGLETPDGVTEGSNEDNAARCVSEEVAALRASCNIILETLKLPLTGNDKLIERLASDVVNKLRVYDMLLLVRKHCIQTQDNYRQMKMHSMISWISDCHREPRETLPRADSDEISSLYLNIARKAQLETSQAILTSATFEGTPQSALSEATGPSETPHAPSSSAKFEGALPMAAVQGQISAATAEFYRKQMLDSLSTMEVHLEKLREHLRRL